MRALLAAGPWPARNPDQNMADLRAQVAANEKGVQELHAMVAQFGLDTVRAYMRHVQDNAEESVRRAIARLDPALGGDGRFVLPLDNGARIEVAVRIDRERRCAVVDFTGTSAQLPNNFNAPRAVTVAAVLYVFRTLVDDDIPLNAGCLKPIEIVVPAGSMLNPRWPAAVVAGNVETSSCVTNALYGALGVLAGSQPTMNNFTFGSDRYQYYETISGGSGAGPALGEGGDAGFDGTAVVQTHMTNSRLTDPEVLEFRYPVRLESYEIRRGTGGAGRWRGGDGGTARDPLPGAADRRRSSPTAASTRRSGWPAGRRARRDATASCAPTARSRRSATSARSRCARATPSSSRRRPAAATAPRDRPPSGATATATATASAAGAEAPRPRRRGTAGAAGTATATRAAGAAALRPTGTPAGSAEPVVERVDPQRRAVVAVVERLGRAREVRASARRPSPRPRSPSRAR